MLLVTASLLSACGSERDTDAIAQGARLCPAGATTEGIDVSVYQGTIDWTKVKTAGIEFAFIRVGDGLPPIDSKFQTNWTAARAVGIVRGAYQFFRQDEDATAQADLMLDTMGPLEDDDLPPVADVESDDGASAGEIVANVRTWAQRIQAGSGRTPIIYTGPGFWNYRADGSSGVSNLPLWLAQWTTDCPLMANGFARWTFWQYSSTGSVSGILADVDRDRFNGDRAALDGFIEASKIAPEETADAGPLPDAPTTAPPLPPDGGEAALTMVSGGCGVAGGVGSGWWWIGIYLTQRRRRSAASAANAPRG